MSNAASYPELGGMDRQIGGQIEQTISIFPFNFQLIIDFLIPMTMTKYRSPHLFLQKRHIIIAAKHAASLKCWTMNW